MSRTLPSHKGAGTKPSGEREREKRRRGCGPVNDRFLSRFLFLYA